MQLKPNQLHIMTIHAQGNEIIGKGHKVFNDMLCVIKKPVNLWRLSESCKG
jgi:hypothetical protein